MNIKRVMITATLAFAMAVTLAPGNVNTAQGLTTEELQQQIAQLQAQLQQLQATGTVATAEPSACVGITFTRDLSRNSTGADVRCLQALLNQLNVEVSTAGPGSPGNETTFFGDATKAAVERYQTLNNISPAAGYVGPITRASLNANLGEIRANGSASTGTFPAGCTSNEGFSTTTGESCAAPSGLPAGCTSTAGYSPTTGVKCDSGSTLPAGCTSTTGYSPTTGVKCDGTTTDEDDGDTTTDTTLTGTASIQNVTTMSQHSNENVGEGQNDVKVLGRDIEMDNTGNARLQNVRVKFDRDNSNDGSKVEVSGSSTRFDRYAKDVSVWLNGSEVGRVAASSLSRTSSGVYTGTITLDSSAILNSGASNELEIAVSGASNIDSADIGENWEVNIENIRYTDGSGAVIIDSSTGTLTDVETLTFVSLTTSSDVKLRIALASDNPKETIHQVSTTATTNDITVLKGTLKAERGQLWLDEAPFRFTVTSDEAEVSDVVSRARLVLDGTSFTGTLPTLCTTASACTVTFDDLGKTITANATISFSVVIDAKALGSEFVAGDSLKVELRSTERDNIVVEDTNGDNLADARKEGVANGRNQTFRDTGINAVKTSESFSSETGTDGKHVTATYKLTLDVTAFGNTFYIGETAQDADAPSATNAVAYRVEQAGGTNNTGAKSATVDTNAPAEGSGVRLDDGVTRSLTLTVTLTGSDPDDAHYRLQAKELRVFTDSALSTGEVRYVPLPAADFRTGLHFLNFN